MLSTVSMFTLGACCKPQRSNKDFKRVLWCYLRRNRRQDSHFDSCPFIAADVFCCNVCSCPAVSVTDINVCDWQRMLSPSWRRLLFVSTFVSLSRQETAESWCAAAWQTEFRDNWLDWSYPRPFLPWLQVFVYACVHSDRTYITQWLYISFINTISSAIYLLMT